MGMSIISNLYPNTTATEVEYDNNSTLADELDTLKYSMYPLLSAYPIGCIYMTFSDENPANTLGGTWVRVYSRFLFGADDTEDGPYSVHAIGGATTTALTLSNLPKHAHDTPFFNNMTYNLGVDKSKDFVGVYGKGQTAAEACADMGVDSTEEIWWLSQTNKAEGTECAYLTSYKGSGTTIKTTPPYICAYVWKRTA